MKWSVWQGKDWRAGYAVCLSVTFPFLLQLHRNDDQKAAEEAISYHFLFSIETDPLKTTTFRRPHTCRRSVFNCIPLTFFFDWCTNILILHLYVPSTTDIAAKTKCIKGELDANKSNLYENLINCTDGIMWLWHLFCCSERRGGRYEESTEKMTPEW